MTPDEAKAVIVDNIVAYAIDVAECYWEDYPLIGEHDWDGIVQAVMVRGAETRPTAERFRDAYRLLAERADHERQLRLTPSPIRATMTTRVANPEDKQ